MLITRSKTLPSWQGDLLGIASAAIENEITTGYKGSSLPHSPFIKQQYLIIFPAHLVTKTSTMFAKLRGRRINQAPEANDVRYH